MKKVKPKKCKACGELFTPFQTTQQACSVTCAMDIAKEKADKEYRKETRIRKEKLKTRSQWMKECQVAFNAYIRKRDEKEPCICCGRTGNDRDLMTGSRWDAGHYRSVGSCPELRFHPMNCHKQLVYCNRDRSGNVVDYRIRLREKIGDKMLEWLEGPHEPQKWSVDDLREIKAYYREQTKILDQAG